MIDKSYLLICLIAITAFALPVMLYPFRKSKLPCLVIFILCVVVLIAYAYWIFGSWSMYSEHLQTITKKQQLEAILKSKSSSDWIQQLKDSLTKNPRSSRGWYLLGRIYLSENKVMLASKAFAKAYKLQPLDELITINYALSLWRLNQQVFTSETRNLFKLVLQLFPRNPEALAMLAIDAFKSQNYKLAIDYWQRLLLLTQPQTTEARMIYKAIANAEKILMNHEQ